MSYCKEFHAILQGIRNSGIFFMDFFFLIFSHKDMGITIQSFMKNCKLSHFVVHSQQCFWNQVVHNRQLYLTQHDFGLFWCRFLARALSFLIKKCTVRRLPGTLFLHPGVSVFKETSPCRIKLALKLKGCVYLCGEFWQNLESFSALDHQHVPAYTFVGMRALQPVYFCRLMRTILTKQFIFWSLARDEMRKNVLRCWLEFLWESPMEALQLVTVYHSAWRSGALLYT